MKLQLIVPHYKEPIELVARFLDSIALQRFINFNDFEVLIINDGNDMIIDPNFFESYAFPIRYYIKEHTGASSTREYGTQVATADYLLFCDCDDLFNSVDAIWRLLNAIEQNAGDVICSSYLRDYNEANSVRIIHYTADRVKTMCMIHGKLFRRQFLIDNNLHWPTQFQNRHEDFYFYSLVLSAAPKIAFIEQEIYIWKYRPDSLSDHAVMSELEQEMDRATVELAVLKQLKSRGAMLSFKLKLIDLLFNTYCYSQAAHLYNRVEDNLAVAKETYKEFAKDIAQLTKEDIVSRISTCGIEILNKVLFANLSFINWLELLAKD